MDVISATMAARSKQVTTVGCSFALYNVCQDELRVHRGRMKRKALKGNHSGRTQMPRSVFRRERRRSSLGGPRGTQWLGDAAKAALGLQFHSRASICELTVCGEVP